jgi:hypothetical protein
MAVEPMQEPRGRTVFAVFLILSLLVALPVLAVALPPILDYPNHLARMHLLTLLPASRELARYYALAWAPLPDLALDAVVPPLTRLMPVEDAMRLFLVTTLLALAGGCLALHRAAFRRWSVWPLFSFLLLYNRMLLWGFLNYLAGLAIALWGLAAWIALDRRPMPLRIVAGMAFATTIYFAHLAAFGVYAIAIIAFSVAGRLEPNPWTALMRRLWPALLSLAPSILLFLASPTSGAPSQIAFGNPLRKLDLPVSIFDNYNRIFDGTTFAVLLIAIVFGLVRKAIVAHTRLRWSVLAVMLAFVLMPSRFLSASGIDHRLPIAIAFLLIATTDWSGLTFSRQRQIGIALFALFAVRLAVIGNVWVQADRQYAALMPVFALIPQGGALAVATPARDVQAGGVPLLHFPALAAAQRDAFVPTLFADPAQQPLRLTPEGARLAAAPPPVALWQAAAGAGFPSLTGYNALMIIDPPTPLDRTHLPGKIVFEAPRLMLIDLSRPPEEPRR